MKHSLTISALLISLIASAVSLADTQTSDSNIQVMVLGSFHFAGSDADLINVKPDDVLHPDKQRELAAIAQALATFKPTVVVTERVTEAPDYIDPHFADFTAEELSRNRNERAQLAYRVAQVADVRRVHGLDERSTEGEPDYFPFGRVREHAASTGQDNQLQAALGEVEQRVSAEMSIINDLHLAEALIRVNDGFLSSPEFYYALSQYDVGEAQPAAELQAYWFMRNAKIFSKLIDISQPGDRVLVVFGAGHKFWLDHFVEHTRNFEPVSPVPYLKRAVNTQN